MAYVTPGTVAAGDVATAAAWNVLVGNDVSFRDGTGVVPPIAIVRRAAAQSITTTSLTKVSFDTEDVDTNGMFTATSTDITIQTSGVYLLAATVQVANNATGIRDGGFQKNGTIINTGAGVLAANMQAVNGGDSVLTMSGIANLVATDIITLYIYQTSGSSLNITSRASLALLGRTS